MQIQSSPVNTEKSKVVQLNDGAVNWPRLYSLKKYTTSLIDLYYERYPSYLKSMKMMDRNCMIKLGDVWINYQKSGEYIPTHEHDGVYSFNIWIKLPYNSTVAKTSHNIEFLVMNR